MLDVVISGGTVIDGTGAPGRAADVAVRDGRVVSSETRVNEPARHRIDARGKIVAPGFVDIHTHYDAQVFWDPVLSPSPFHGVTTVVGGNCGFSIAPLVPEAGPYLMRMLARVEGMPLESLEAGVPWDWRSFGEYLDRLEGRIAVNAGFLVGHSAIRRVVMGEAAVGQEASEAQLDAMARLLGESIAAGAGFSPVCTTHNDGVMGRCRRASRRARSCCGSRRSSGSTRARPSSSSPRSAPSRRPTRRSWPRCRRPRTVRSTGTCSR